MDEVQIFKMFEIGVKILVSSLSELPFDIIILHDVVEEIHIVGHTYGCHDPENGVSVNSWERFGIFFLLTWNINEKIT